MTGVIAQEVEQVAPELVFTMGNGLKGVKYNQLTGLLVEAIKDQQSQIVSLEGRMAAAEQALAQMGINIQQGGSNNNVQSFLVDGGSTLSTTRNISTTGEITASAINASIIKDAAIKLININSFKVLDSSNAPILEININGKISLKESPNGSTGNISIPTGQTQVIVDNTSITNNSRVVVTPDQIVNFRVTNKIAGQSFTIEISTEQSVDVTFDYIVIN